jgi:hypothetical protein
MGLVQGQIVLKGESRTFRLTVTQRSDGTRVDLTGTTLEFQVKVKVGDGDPPLIAKAIGTGVTLLNQTMAATKGQADIALSPSDTATLAAGVYAYDVVLVLLGGERHYVVPPSEFVVRAVVNAP